MAAGVAIPVSSVGTGGCGIRRFAAAPHQSHLATASLLGEAFAKKFLIQAGACCGSRWFRALPGDILS